MERTALFPLCDALPRSKEKNTFVDVLSFLGVEFSRWGPVEEELACIRKHLDQQSISLAPMPQVRDLVN